jgi:putative tryptophan/tyrosine transport system substrate-binding protein
MGILEDFTMQRSAIGVMVTFMLGILAAPLVTAAQPAAKIPRIGILMSATPAASQHFLEAFRHGLREQGWVEGQNIFLEPRWAEGKPERFPDLVAELIQLKVALLFTPNTSATYAAQAATRTIPIVAIVGDPVGAGFVASLARPGGNITGLTPTAEISQKWLELLREAVPTASRVAVLWHPGIQVGAVIWRELQGAATALGMTLHSLEASSTAELEQVLAGMTRERADALIVVPTPLTMTHRKQIVEVAVQQQLPGIYGWREFVEAGGLMSYAPNLADLYRRAATYVDKILKNTKPADLPVERAMKFELIINLKTAKALGLTIPPTLLFQADEVIR